MLSVAQFLSAIAVPETSDFIKIAYISSVFGRWKLALHNKLKQKVTLHFRKKLYP